jgi:hypothetical protein
VACIQGCGHHAREEYAQHVLLKQLFTDAPTFCIYNPDVITTRQWPRLLDVP